MHNPYKLLFHNITGTLTAFLLTAYFPTNSGYASISETFQKADKHFVVNKNEQAIKLYDKVIADGSDDRLVILSRYKKAYILDTRLFRYEEAIKSYKEFIRNYPNTPLSGLAKKKHDELLKLAANRELDDYSFYRKKEAEFYRLSNPNSKIRKEQKVIAKEIFHFAFINPDLSFKEKLLKTSLMILIDTRLFFHARKIIEIMKDNPQSNPNSYKQEEVFVNKNVSRYKFYWASLVVIGSVVIIIITGKGWKGLRFAVLNRMFHLMFILLVPLISSVIYYYVFVVKDQYTRFNTEYLICLFVTYLFAITLSCLYNNSLSIIRNSSLRNIMKYSLSILLGLSAWTIYAFHFDYLWAIGL